jgi:two-component system, OmpR family, sensor kinase
LALDVTRASRFRSLPIRLRVALGYALLLLALIGGVGLFAVAMLRDNLQREIDHDLVLRSLQVERSIGSYENGGPPNSEQVAAALGDLAPTDEFATPGVYVEVVDAAGTRLGSSPNLPGGALPDATSTVAAALGGVESYTTIDAGRERVRVLAHPIVSAYGGPILGAIVVGESLHLVDLAVRRTEGALALAGMVAVVASFAGGWWLAARALGPVVQVTRVARRIEATGRFDQRIAVPPARDELGELVATFNEMIQRLDSVFRRQREFLADASHELRGPLAVIRGNLDLLQLDLPADERRTGAREAAEEAERMSRLIADLLFLSEVDAQESVRREPVALADVVAAVFTRARDLDAGRHRLELGRLDPATILGDRDRIAQLVWNLTENALRYTPEDGRVSLLLRREAPIVELSVADTGVGIPAEHLPRLFERFYRVDKARSRERGGTGLGLAIVRQIAEAHGGQVRVRSEPGEGSIFTVALPCQSD